MVYLYCFILFLGLGYITFGIKALSLGLTSAKRGTLTGHFCKMGHISPYSMALYPLCGGVLHIIDVSLGILVVLLVVIVHLCLLYIGRRYFHLTKHCILSCLGCTSTLCKEAPPSKRIVIYPYYSLLRHGLLSFGLFMLFLCYF